MADTALFVAIWHENHLRLKLNDGLLTNENEETNTLKGGGSCFRGLAHVPDRSARVLSSARLSGVAYPCPSSFADCAIELQILLICIGIILLIRYIGNIFISADTYWRADAWVEL